MNLIKELTDKNIAHPPIWLPDATQYLTKMGSQAYGCSDDDSDLDIYGFCIPPLDMIFPHLRGEILDFGDQHQRFKNHQEHHLLHDNFNYDISIYSIVHYFHLLMENNPNMTDSIFTYDTDVIFQTKISKLVRDNKHIFLHRGAYHRYTGYAHSQFHKIKNKNGHENEKRNNSIKTFGYDVKYGYHLLRLMLEISDILNNGTFDIKANSAYLKEIRQGKYTFAELETEFNRLDRMMAIAYENSKLPDKPDELAIKKLLLNCIEEHHGKLEFFKL